MRKFAFIIVVLMAISCSSDKKEIEAAAKGYLQAMGNYQIDEAIPFASSHTKENTIPFIKHIMEHTDTAYVNSNRPATITIKRTNLISDSIACVYYHKSTPIKEVDDSVTLILENGQWLVDIHLKPLPFPIVKDTTHVPVRNFPKNLQKNTTHKLPRQN